METKVRIIWSALEWRRVTLFLARKFPEILTGDLSRINSKELALAGEKALPSGRQRAIHHGWRVKNGAHVLEAAKYLAALPNLEQLLKDPNATPPHDGATSARKNAVRWHNEDWLKLYDTLVEHHPLFRDSFKGLTMPIVAEVMGKAFPPERHRRFAALTLVLPELEIAKRSRALEAATEPIQERAEEPEAEDKDDGRATRWGIADWVKLAEEIHRQNPYYGWPYKEHYVGLTVEECKAAQAAAIPVERRRKFTNITAAREHLAEAFRVVRARIEEEKAAKDRELEHERKLSQLRLDEERARAELQLTLAAATAPVEEPLTIKLAQALTPMVKILAEEFGKSFAAALLPTIQSAFTGMIQPQKEPEAEPSPVAKPAASDPLDLQPPSSYSGPEGMGFRQPRIAVIGPSNLNAYLEEAFPDIEFTYIERAPKGIAEAIQHCDRIIGIDKFTTEAARKALRGDVGKTKFTLVSGGTSAVKRQISLWLNAGVIGHDRRESPHARLQ